MFNFKVILKTKKEPTGRERNKHRTGRTLLEPGERNINKSEE